MSGPQRATRWRTPRFRAIEPGEEPRYRDAVFGEPAFQEREEARWAGETEADRVDAMLRTGRLETTDWPLTPEGPSRNVWRRLWERIKGD